MSPTWLAEKITASSRRARPTTCRHCGADTLTGLDNDKAALLVVVDATPVGPGTELRALIHHRASYDLVSGELHHRAPWHLRASARHPVLLDHGCEVKR